MGPWKLGKQKSKEKDKKSKKTKTVRRNIFGLEKKISNIKIPILELRISKKVNQK
jgi:hypothetical protein